MIVTPVPMSDVWAWRDDVAPMLARVDRWLGGRLNAEDLLDACEQDRMLLWVIHSFDEELVAVIVTQVVEFPRMRVLSFVACAGSKVKSWLKPVDVVLREYAVSKGCTKWEIWARRGWKRMLSGLAPRELLVVLEGDT